MTDFVIAWVDGNDKEWQEEKAKYSCDSTQDAKEARYREWGNLRYWFRAVEQYAPWVHKIYFVTCGHIPEWLDTCHPRLEVVEHKDFIPEKYLPTFNSHTIELNLHRIPGLARQFVYFNDDMFLTDYVEEGHFFRNGLPCDEFILDAVYFEPTSAGAYNGNDLEIINKYWDMKKLRQSMHKERKNARKIYSLKYGWKNLYRTFVLMRWNWFPGFHYNHLPTSFLKSTLEEVWEKEGQRLDETCMDKFRSKRNVNQWLFKYWQLASMEFWPRDPGLGKAFHLKGEINKSLADAITKHTYKMICINDTAKTKHFEQHKEMVLSSFQKILPNKSRYEK